VKSKLVILVIILLLRLVLLIKYILVYCCQNKFDNKF